MTGGTPAAGFRRRPLGPVDSLAIEFPGGRLTSSGFEQLLVWLTSVSWTSWIWNSSPRRRGRSKKIDSWDFAVPEGVDLRAWAGASSGLLDDSDVAEISARCSLERRSSGDLKTFGLSVSQRLAT